MSDALSTNNAGQPDAYADYDQLLSELRQRNQELQTVAQKINALAEKSRDEAAKYIEQYAQTLRAQVVQRLDELDQDNERLKALAATEADPDNATFGQKIKLWAAKHDMKSMEKQTENLEEGAKEAIQDAVSALYVASNSVLEALHARLRTGAVQAAAGIAVAQAKIKVAADQAAASVNARS